VVEGNIDIVRREAKILLSHFSINLLGFIKEI
jgi:hypothetical protein